MLVLFLLNETVKTYILTIYDLIIYDPVGFSLISTWEFGFHYDLINEKNFVFLNWEYEGRIVTLTSNYYLFLHSVLLLLGIHTVSSYRRCLHLSIS